MHYNDDNSYLFDNGKREFKFKAKDDQIVKEIYCLGNISDDWTAANAQKTGFWGEIYDFAVDYTSTNIGDIYNVHRYLMKKHNINSQFFRTYKMWLINLAISLFSVLKVNSLECLSLINRKCMPRPKILNVNEEIGEALFYSYNVQVNKCSGNCDTCTKGYTWNPSTCECQCDK